MFQILTYRGFTREGAERRSGGGAPPPTHLLPLHDDGLRQRVVAALLVGEALQIIQLSLELEDELLLFLPLSLQTLPLLSVALTTRITHTHTRAE